MGTRAGTFISIFFFSVDVDARPLYASSFRFIFFCFSFSHFASHFLHHLSACPPVSHLWYAAFGSIFVESTINIQKNFHSLRRTGTSAILCALRHTRLAFPFIFAIFFFFCVVVVVVLFIYFARAHSSLSKKCF